MSDLASAGVKAAKWTVLTTVARFGLQLVAQVILARLLGPDAYGIFGMGMVVYTLSNFLATFGFAWGLAQLKDITQEDIRVAFTKQMLVGLLAGVIMFFSAPWVRDYFHDPRLLSVTHWMAFTCLINAAGSVSGNIMRRAMNFRAMGLIQVGSYFFGYILIGVPLAYMGAGVYALIGAWMTQAFIVWAIGFYLVRHPVRPLWKSENSAALTRIGGAVFFTNIGNWMLSNIDRLMIGRFLNPTAMGVYAVGFNLANMPNTLLLGALQPVFLAAGARVQDDLGRLRSAYCQVSAVIWVILLPAFAMLSLMSADIIRLLYGPAWAQATSVLQILFLTMPAFVTWGMSTPVLWNTERAHHEVLLQLPILPLAVLAFYFFARQTIEQAALVAAAVFAARGLVLAIAASRVVKVSIKEWLSWILRGLTVTALSLALPAVFLHWGPHALPAIVALAIEAALGFGVMAAIAWIYPALLGRDAAGLLVRFLPRFRPRMLSAGFK